MATITATTSRIWINAPPICTIKPNSQRTKRITTIAQRKPRIPMINLLFFYPSSGNIYYIFVSSPHKEMDWIIRYLQNTRIIPTNSFSTQTYEKQTCSGLTSKNERLHLNKWNLFSAGYLLIGLVNSGHLRYTFK